MVAFTSCDIEQYVYCNCLLTRLWRHGFWNYPCLSNQAVFPTWPNSHDKKLNILRTKELLRWNKKHSSSFLKGFQWSKERNFFLESESPTLKETRNSLKKWPLNLWWFSHETIMKVENITKAATFKSFLHLSHKNSQLLFCDSAF